MKTSVYTFVDDQTGLNLSVDATLYDMDYDPPEVIIDKISYDGKEIDQGCLSLTYKDHLENRVFMQWCSEVTKETRNA